MPWSSRRGAKFPKGAAESKYWTMVGSNSRWTSSSSFAGGVDRPPPSGCRGVNPLGRPHCSTLFATTRVYPANISSSSSVSGSDVGGGVRLWPEYCE
jgi:hypothetical protein